MLDAGLRLLDLADALHARANLANVLRKLGDLDGALDQATRALAIITAIRGEDHPDLSPGRSVLALVHEARGEWVPAREQYLTSLRLLERPEGGGSRRLGRPHATVDAAGCTLRAGVLRAMLAPPCPTSCRPPCCLSSSISPRPA